MYVALLAAAYRRYELSLVYPVARGLAPVLALLLVVAAGGARPSTLGVVGVLAVAVGVLLVRGARRAISAGSCSGSSIAAAIAGYTVVDRYGIRHAAAGPYLLLVMLGPALVYSLAVGRDAGAGRGLAGDVRDRRGLGRRPTCWCCSRCASRARRPSPRCARRAS